MMVPMWSRRLLSLTIALAWAAPSWPAGLAVGSLDEDPSELAAAVQRKYDHIRDFSADFVHTYQGGVLKKRLTEGGRVFIKKPGKMRWEYRTPEEKLFVSDALKLYSYIPADKQVVVSPVPPDDQATTPLLFLAGKVDVRRDFTPSVASMPAGLPAGIRVVKLVPRSAQPDYDWLILAVDPGSLALKSLITSDAQGGTSTFTFANLKENTGISDKAFEFRIPRGVAVVTESTR